jgi:hypothetical protein
VSFYANDTGEALRLTNFHYFPATTAGPATIKNSGLCKESVVLAPDATTIVSHD